MSVSTVPELQQKLFKRMGLDVPENIRSTHQGRRPGQKLSRKEQRKAQRVQKKTHIYAKQPPVDRKPQQQRRPQQIESRKPSSAPVSRQPVTGGKRSRKEDDNDDDDDDEDEDEVISLGEDDEDEDEDDLSEGDDEDDDADEETHAKDSSKSKGLSRSLQDRLAQDDAEIDELERKLGIKKGRKSLPQAFKEDGLADLMGDLDGGDLDEPSDDDDSKKRKSEYDEWLASKRRKTSEPQRPAKRARKEADEDEDDESALDDGSDEDEDDLDLMDDDGDEEEDGDEESFDGFDSDAQDTAPAEPRQRENPYRAPTTGVTVAKYVPPSLRKGAVSDDENKIRLRKQVQGLINRLTDANILSIVQSVEELYQKNARGDVTDIITDALMAQICKPESMPDQFFVLTGGFAAAIYRVIGSSFGSHLIRRVVTEFETQYNQASKDVDPESGIQKEASNLLTFLSQLYVFEVVTCKIVFDYMERLLIDLAEINVELLLRISRMAGRMLRRDDSQAIKHVAGVLNKAVAKTGYANVSARTKFMIETITDLKNSKPKARGMDSAVVSEHVQRMKKRLGELKSQSRRLDGLAPMGMGLNDIEGADTLGKWWLVGASVPVKPQRQTTTTTADDEAEEDEEDYNFSDHEDMDIVLPDYPQKARAQGLSGTAQVSIFTALMSANDAEHGYRQFVNLRLKKDDQLEIARVLVQCVGSEAQYNPYYALIGQQACANSKIRFALQDRLWKIFRGLGESLFGEEAEEEETAEGERMKDERRMGNVAQFYGSLVASGVLTIAVLKPVVLAEANEWTSQLVQRFVVALLQECRSKEAAKEDMRVEKVFGPARNLPGLAAGVHWMLRKKIRKTKCVSAKELKKLEGVRVKAQATVQAVAALEG